MRAAEEIKEYLNNYQPTSAALTKGQQGAITGMLNEVWQDEMRHLCLQYLFGKSSSKDLSMTQWIALYDWIGFWYSEDDTKWKVGADFRAEAVNVLNLVLKLYEETSNAARALMPSPPPILSGVIHLGGKIVAIDESGDEIAHPTPLRNSTGLSKNPSKVDF